MSATITSPPAPGAAFPPPQIEGESTTVVLLVEDNLSDARLIEESLKRARPLEADGRVELRRVARLEDALQAIAAEPPDAILLDLTLPDSRGLETFRRVHDRAPTVPVVVLSGLADESVAARAVRDGAQDYLVKGQADGQVLVRSLRYAIARCRAEVERAARLRERWARTEAENAQGRFALLAMASRAFAEAGLEFDVGARAVTRSAAELLGDGCAIFLLPEAELRSATGQHVPEQALDLVALHHTEPSARRLALELLDAAPLRLDEAHVRQILDQSMPVLLADIAPDRWQESIRPEHRPYLSRFPVRSAVGVPLRMQGSVGGILAMWRDVSAGRFVEDDSAFLQDLADRAALALENARLYQQVQDALHTRDAFLSSVAHDLKAPLTSIKVQAQLLNRQLARVLPKEGEASEAPAAALTTRALDIDQTVNKMTRMLDELVDLTRLQMGQPLLLQRKSLDLVALAKQTISEYQQNAADHQITLAEAPDSLVGDWDEMRLERVLNNLIGNAVKYSPEGGEITVRIRQETQDGREWAVVTVSDQGLGIPEADLPHIFERFRRAGNVADRIRGTGIGLSSSRQIVEQHEGTISVISREGEGSAFT
ncbi:MAG TPA: ATP-binding protein, partial [Chloroflexota bacterium]|nr:ATP-binding protein [Chloroflexota bacterium]